MNPQRSSAKSSNLNSWVVSSFGVLPVKNKASKRQNVPPSMKTFHKSDRKEIVSSKKAKTDDLWTEKYKPQTEDQLAVHKKKYQDVRLWFEENLCWKGSKMLLLTGPAGAGKTATVEILSSQLGFKTLEWHNQPGVTVSYGENLFDESQVSTFRNFLLKSSRYKNQIFLVDEAEDCTKKQVIVIEEFPTCFSNNVQELHSIVRSYARVGTCPIVFIVTDGARNATNERNFFPIMLQQELNITNISFNPVAQSNMVRALSRIAEAEELSISKVTLDAVAENSHGDVRSAVNTLQFGCSTLKRSSLVRKVIKPKTRGSKRTLKWSVDGNDDVVDIDLASFGSRDDSLFLFHALGKILHCKRGLESCKVESILPPKLKEMERFPLLVNPEDVWERTSVSGPTFAAFLHQNYVEFYSEITDISCASKYLSLSDVLSSYWTGSDVLDLYSVSVATRGIMHSNKKKVSVGFKKLHKPKLFTVLKTCDQISASGRNFFHDRCLHLSLSELYTQVIPMASKFIKSSLTEDQKSFVRENLPPLSGLIRCHSEMLSENELFSPETVDDERVEFRTGNGSSVFHFDSNLENESYSIEECTY